MAEAARPLPISPEEYLKLEEVAETRSEYVDGRFWAMAGASDRHNGVAINLVAALVPPARAAGCRVYASDMKLRVAEERFYYPDLMALCEPDGEPLFKVRPCLVVEVLSASTEARDRGEKLRAYLALPSLGAYLLVDPERRLVEMYRREAPGWTYSVVEGDGALDLPCPPVRLSLDEVYAGL